MYSPSDFNDDVSVFKDSQDSPYGNYCSAPVESQYIAEPDHESYTEGRAPLNTLPAQWWNWLLNQITKKLNGVNKYVGNVFTELSNLLGLMGITPSEPSVPTGNQLSTGFLNNYPNVISKFLHTIASIWSFTGTTVVGDVTTTQTTRLPVCEHVNVSDASTTPATETDTYTTKYVEQLPVKLGGTGATDEETALKNLVVPLDIAALSAVQDTDHIVVDIENSSNVHFIKRFSITNLAALISHAISNLTIPVGTVWTTLADTDDTDNHFLICNGRTLSRTTYASLWNFAYNRNLVRDAEHPNRPFGPGDSSTTFEIPDLRETVLVGAGQSTSTLITEHDVYALGEFKDDQFQGHWHYSRQTGGDEQTIDWFPFQATNQTRTATFAKNVTDAVTDGTNGTPRTGTTTHGKQIGVNYIIKY